jgi:hypothetical protein
VTAAATTTIKHLRPRGAGATQPTTTIELFFDLVYVFAVTQLSHQILDHLTLAGVARTAFLLLTVWWAWIYTTWMANWFDPQAARHRLKCARERPAARFQAVAAARASGSWIASSAGWPSRLIAPGATPITRLNARAKAASER